MKKVTKISEVKPTSQAAKKILEQAQQRRVEEFTKKLQDLITEFRVVLRPRTTMVGNQIIQDLDVLALPE